MGIIDLAQSQDVERLRRSILESQLLVLNRSNSQFYDKIIKESELKSSLLNGALRASECRVVKEDTPVDPYSYTEGSGKSLYITQDEDRYIDAKKVLSLYSEGCSISLMSLERRYPQLARLRNRLIHEFSASVHMNLYASPKGGKGLAVHEDYHDVIILQLSGSKHWEIFDRKTTLPLEESSRDPNYFKRKEKVDEFVLQKGDLAFIPRGISHRAYAKDESSIHLTIGVDWYTYKDLFSQFLSDLAERDIDLRRPLFNLQTQTDMADYVSRFRGLCESDACHDAMYRAVEKLEKKLRNSVLDEQVGGLLSMDLLLENINDSSLLRVNHSQFTSIVSSEDGNVLKYPGNEIQVHPGFMDLVVRIVGCFDNAFSLQSILNRASSPEERKFIRFLVKDGFLVVIG